MIIIEKYKYLYCFEMYIIINRVYLIKLMNLLLKMYGWVNKFLRWKKMMKVGKCLESE